MSSESKAISRTIDSSLRAPGITQRTAALSTGIPLNTLNRGLTGHSPRYVDELRALADLLGKRSYGFTLESENSLALDQSMKVEE
jgi:hypothetical protein